MSTLLNTEATYQLLQPFKSIEDPVLSVSMACLKWWMSSIYIYETKVKARCPIFDNESAIH